MILPLLLTIRDCHDAELLDRLAVLADALDDAGDYEGAAWVRDWDVGHTVYFDGVGWNARRKSTGTMFGPPRGFDTYQEAWRDCRDIIMDRLAAKCATCDVFIPRRYCPVCSGHGLVLRQPATCK